MRIAIYSMYYWPEPSGTAPYVRLPAEDLAARGHDVSVVCGVPHYPSWERSGRYPMVSTEHSGGVTIHRRQHYVPSRPTASKRAVYEATMFAGTLSAVPVARHTDIVIGVMPALASANAAAIAARLYRKPLGLIIHDLMGRGAQQAGVAGGRLTRLIEQRERAVVRAADRCLVLNDAFRAALDPAGVRHDIFTTALPAAPRDLGGIDRTLAREQFGWAGSDQVCVHAGNMGQKQGLMNLIETSAYLADVRGKPQVVFAGDGNDKPKLLSKVRELGLSNVQFLPSLNDEDYDRLLVAADVLLLNQRPEVEDMSYPSKLSAYLSAGRPVVGAVAADSPAGRVLSASSGGVIVPPAAPQAAAAAIADLIGDPDRAAQVGRAGREFATANLTLERMLDRYSHFVDAVALAGQE